MKKAVTFYNQCVLIFLFGLGSTLLLPEQVSAQSYPCYSGNYTLIGNATLDPVTHELQLTPDLQYQKGGIWSNNKASLSQPFDYTANVYLGNKDNTGADGLCFVLQDSPSGLAAIGMDGRGIGACDGDDGGGGIKPSLTIEIDTWQNHNLGWLDPAEDHIAAHVNGDGRHANEANIVIHPVTIANIEDDAYHAFRVTWNPTTQLIQIYLDGTLKASTNYDLVGYFGGTAVYWGYTASTGDSKNQHKVCPQGTLDATIVANNDIFLNANGTTGGTLGNALTNDKLNFSPATTGTVSITVLDPDPSGKVTLNTTTGAITLAALTPAGTYTLRYQICEIANPSNCTYAYVKVDTRQYSQISITPANIWAQQSVNHCWTATVLDNLNAPVAGVTVDFTVTGLHSSGLGSSATTDINGQAQFCYPGYYPEFPKYTNTITATIHGTVINASTDVNWYVWTLGSVTLTPKTGTSVTNIENCWQALVKDGGYNQSGVTIPPQPLPNQTVSFTIMGPNNAITIPNAISNSDGLVYFCYAGPNAGTDHQMAQSGSKSDYAQFDWTAPVPTYALTYDGNGATGGSAPVDPNSPYPAAANVTVLGNVGSPALFKTGNIFSGWNTQAGGGGTTYLAGATLIMPAAATTLYAIWTPAYTLTYDGNGATGGSAPVDPNSPYPAAANVTVLGNVGSPALFKTGNIFSGWNTQAGGGGTTYLAGATLIMPAAATTLYAIWTPVYTLTYNANGATGGNAPVDPNSPYPAEANVTVLGNVGSPALFKTGNIFNGWNTQAGGGGTTYLAGATLIMPAAATTLYAMWLPNIPPTVTGVPENVSCYGLSNGAVNITVSLGTTPYTYLWSNYATTQNISGLTIGSYSVTVTDVNSLTATGNWTVTQPDAVVPLISGPTTICQNSTGNTYTTDAGMSNYQWVVSAGGTITAGTGTNTITVTWNSFGAQTVSVNYTKAGCTAEVPTVKNINVIESPTPVISGPATVSQGETDTYSTPYISGHLYNWNVVFGTFILCDANDPNCIRVTWAHYCNITVPGQVTVTETNPVTGCSKTVTLLITIN